MLPFVVASILHLRVLAALEVVVFQSELGRAFYGRVTLSWVALCYNTNVS